MTTSLRYENNAVIDAINLPPADVVPTASTTFLSWIDDEMAGADETRTRGVLQGFRHELSRGL
jgi:hypothetical protein